MTTTSGKLQQWADSAGVCGIRFYPENPTESSVDSINERALNAIEAFQNGLSTPYVDPVQHGPKQ